LRRAIDDLILCLIFFTRLPARWRGDLPPQRITQALRLSPIVGAAVGGMVGGIYAVLELAGLAPIACAAVAVAAGLALTGAFHEDGLADTFDGLGGGATPERKLEIMRDSRVGSYGAAALIMALLVKVALIVDLDDPRTTPIVLAAAGAMAKAVSVVLMHATPPARADGRSAEAGRPGWAETATAAVLGLIATAGAAIALDAPFAILTAVAAAAAAGLGVRVLAMRHVGGQTGDILGATQQASELATMLAFALTLKISH